MVAPLTLKPYAVPEKGSEIRKAGFKAGGQQVLGSLGSPSSIKLRSAGAIKHPQGLVLEGEPADLLPLFSPREESSAQEAIFFKMRYNSHNIKFTILKCYDSVGFSVFTMLATISSLILEHVHHHK